ncbi:hypothetical protein GXW83_19570 [Streptacidiphilus sp. PB12-B1b]|uniref:hypothetical protein n=1 Tax=Streptacidiphilus sp. PB12-B1b TaxID=2705012 RepID=UPI0015FBE899|nr:hypothetical protein [Streptacidiphilus sp. PB12-B1b]QMU77564.1 hypothetical protein GXW83_19570 [Streptacidiphilus sp. PB12-B1b]
MTVLAVTGHIHLTEATVPLVVAALRELLTAKAAKGPLTGLSCIAAGADTLFAQLLVELGGALVAVVPSRDYRQSQVKGEHAALFDSLLAAAAEVIVLPIERAGSEAYAAANRLLLERADELVAVWDGQQRGGPGGTGDMVRRAREAGMAVVRVWPHGATRA